jgi:hypothetical protein
MIASVIGLASPLLDHHSFRASIAAGDFWIHIILAIATGRQSAFPILKCSPADIARQWIAVSFLHSLQDLVGFERRRLHTRIRR